MHVCLPSAVVWQMDPDDHPSQERLSSHVNAMLCHMPPPVVHAIQNHFTQAAHTVLSFGGVRGYLAEAHWIDHMLDAATAPTTAVPSLPSAQASSARGAFPSRATPAVVAMATMEYAADDTDTVEAVELPSLANGARVEFGAVAVADPSPATVLDLYSGEHGGRPVHAKIDTGCGAALVVGQQGQEAMEAAGFKLTQTGKAGPPQVPAQPGPCAVHRLPCHRVLAAQALPRGLQELSTPAQHAVYAGKPLIDAAGLLNVKARRGGGGGGGGRSGSGGQGGRRTPPRA